jgi:hypothetical protein
MTRQCLTCDIWLTPGQERNGTRRCQACRLARPGRLYAHQPPAGVPYYGRPFGKVTERAACTESWWVGLDRAAFQARAEQRLTVGGKAPTKGGDHDV